MLHVSFTKSKEPWTQSPCQSHQNDISSLQKAYLIQCTFLPQPYLYGGCWQANIFTLSKFQPPHLKPICSLCDTTRETTWATKTSWTNRSLQKLGWQNLGSFRRHSTWWQSLNTILHVPKGEVATTIILFDSNHSQRQPLVLRKWLDNSPRFCVWRWGAMYCFLSMEMPPGMIHSSLESGFSPDILHVLNHLQTTGMCTMPTSGFGKYREGTDFRWWSIATEQSLVDSMHDHLGTIFDKCLSWERGGA